MRSDYRQKNGQQQKSVSRSSQGGFTLLEMIVVMVITGILGGMVALFIRGPVQGYVDSARRAGMAGVADTALWRITRDVRMALPNSVRVRGAVSGSGSCNGTENCYLEFIPMTGGGRYRSSSGVAGDDILDSSGTDIFFDVLGELPAFVSGASIVIGNTSPSGASSVYSGYNMAACPAVAPYCASTNAITGKPAITLAASSVLLPLSPGNSLQVISTPVTHVCVPVAGGAGGTLMRYWGYAIQDVQTKTDSIAELDALVNPPTATRGSALLATNVSACSFVLASPGLATMQLTLTESGESISLYGAAHVANVP